MFPLQRNLQRRSFLVCAVHLNLVSIRRFFALGREIKYAVEMRRRRSGGLVIPSNLKNVTDKAV